MENLLQYTDAPKSLIKTLEQSPQQNNYQIYGQNTVFRLENS